MNLKKARKLIRNNHQVQLFALVGVLGYIYVLKLLSIERPAFCRFAVVALGVAMQTMSVKDHAYSLGLNGELALKQGIGIDELKKIKSLHQKVRELDFESQREALQNLNRKSSIKLLKNVMAIEFEMQELWNFPKQAVFHSHTFNLKACTCDCINVSNFKLPRGLGGAYSFKKSCHIHGDGKVAEAFGITPEEAYSH